MSEHTHTDDCVSSDQHDRLLDEVIRLRGLSTVVGARESKRHWKTRAKAFERRHQAAIARAEAAEAARDMEREAKHSAVEYWRSHVADLTNRAEGAEAKVAAGLALANQHDDYCCSKGCAGPGNCLQWESCGNSCTCISAPYLAALAGEGA